MVIEVVKNMTEVLVMVMIFHDGFTGLEKW